MADEATNTSTQPDAENTEHPDKRLIEQWLNKIESARKTPEYKAYLTDITKHRRYVKGELGKDGETTKKAKANLVYATMAGLLPHIYSKNPEIDARPSEAVDESQYGLVKSFAKTLEIVLNRQFKDAKLKKRGKASVRSAMTTSIGWFKVVYQQDIAQDPIIAERINDVQDNLQRIEFLQEAQNDEDASENDQEAKSSELKQQLAALEKKVEVVVAEGLVISRPLSEDITWDTTKIRDFDSVCEDDWLSERFWFNKETYQQKFGKDPHSKAATFRSRTNEDANNTSSPNDSETFYAVHEIWGKVSNTIYTVCEGAEDWARDPYQLDTVGERWNPYFALGLHPVDGSSVPLSTVGFLTELQDEYQQIRKDQEDFRKNNKPHYLADIDTKQQNIERKQIAGIGEVVILDAGGKPLNDIIKRAEMLRVDQEQYDTTATRADIDFMSGLPDAARGGVVKAKTATEADYLQAGLASRTDEMQDQIEDVFLDMAIYSAQVLLQELSISQVVRLAGQGAVWPSMAKEQMFEALNIEIRAGTSGKPNKARELKNWVDFVPALTDTMAKVAELRKSGDNETADVLINITKETLRRLDERIDIEEFMPQEEEEEQGPSEAEMEAMQFERDRAIEELELLRAQVDKTLAETEKVEVDTVIAAVGAGQPEQRTLQ